MYSCSFPMDFPIILFTGLMVAGMTTDLPSPRRPVRLLARSQPSSFRAPSACVFQSCLQSSSRPFPWYIRPHHFPQYAFLICPHHMPETVQSSLRDLFGYLRQSRCVRSCFCLCVSLRTSVVASSSRSPQSVFPVASHDH